MLLLGFVARDQHSYGRTLGRQGAAAERVLTASEHGEGSAAADIALILRVRAITNPSHEGAPAE